MWAEYPPDDDEPRTYSELWAGLGLLAAPDPEKDRGEPLGAGAKVAIDFDRSQIAWG